MTLKEALTQSGITPEQAASLEANGYCIVPMEATGAMIQTGMKAIADAMDEGVFLTPGSVFTSMLAARPKPEDKDRAD